MIRSFRSPEVRGPEVDRIAEQALSIMNWTRSDTLLLDFSGVDFLTADALGRLVTLHRKLKDMGRRLVLTNLTKQVFEVFEITQLHTVLEIHPNGTTQELSAGCRHDLYAELR